MSKDIRSFFKLQSSKSTGKPSTPAANKASLTDDAVIPETPDAKKNQNTKKSKRRRVIDDSSDEDLFDSPKVKKPTQILEKKSKKPEKPVLKEVKPSDIFGKGPIKRAEIPKKKETKKLDSSVEINIHDDEDFEKTLLEIDESNTIEQNYTKSTIKAEPSTNDQISTESTLNPTSKLDSYKIPRKQKVNGHDREDKSDKSRESSTEKTHKARDHHKSPSRHESHHKKDTKKPESPAKTNVNLSQKINGVKVEKNEKKRDFSEFIEDKAGSPREEPASTQHSSKKRKLEQSLNESVVSDEERYEKKRHSAILYQKYLNRTGPKHLGSKQMPEGTPDCLKDLSFVLTGVLDSFEKDEVAAAITKLGGSVKNGVSKKITYVLAGEDPGPAKIAKAEELGIKIINEDEFLMMIVDLSKPQSQKIKQEKHQTDTKIHKESLIEGKSIKTERKSVDVTPTKCKEDKKPASSFYAKSAEKKTSKSFYGKDSGDKATIPPSTSKSFPAGPSTSTAEPTVPNVASTCNITSKANAQLWVDKYRPQNSKQIIGQHGDNSNVKKLTNWLKEWFKSRESKPPRPSPWAKKDDGAYYRAALLSGPPGVGKTTTVSVVCAELGFDVVELNASDTRSKTLIKEHISSLTSTTSLSAYAKGGSTKKKVTKKHVLVMDEVDGMAGNEDRGGLQELILLIKSTSVPIICTCNDRNSPKMRSLVNYCYDLKFSRPRLDQIRGALQSICFKEGLKVPAEALSQLVTAANQDVRQSLNLLALWTADPTAFNADQARKDATNVRKDIKLGPWEAVRKVFTAEEHKTMSIHDKSDLFFYDYSLAPLFVQENYLSVKPHCPDNQILKRFARAANSISLGDLVERKIRSNMAWSLLPMQAMYSSVMPGHHVAGHVAGQIQFPGWLGKNSRAGKMQRLAQQLQTHMRLSTTASKLSVFMDYCKPLRDAIVQPLISERGEGVPRSVEVLQAYNLLKEDLDALTELATWPGDRDPMVLVDSRVKTALTKAYNKVAALPYAPSTVKKGRGVAAELAGPEDDEAEALSDPDSDNDVELDALIKKKEKTAAKSKASTSSGSKAKSNSSNPSKAKPSTSKSDTKSEGSRSQGGGKKKKS